MPIADSDNDFIQSYVPRDEQLIFADDEIAFLKSYFKDFDEEDFRGVVSDKNKEKAWENMFKNARDDDFDAKFAVFHSLNTAQRDYLLTLKSVKDWNYEMEIAIEFKDDIRVQWSQINESFWQKDRECISLDEFLALV